MRFTTIVWKNVARRPGRSALTVSGVAVAVGAVVALVGISRGFERSLFEVYEQRGIDLVVLRAGKIQRLSSSLDESLGEKIARVKGIGEVSPFLADAVSLEDLDLFGVVIQGYPLDSFMLRTMKIVDGRQIEPGDPPAVVLGSLLAKNLGVTVGDTLEVLEDEPHKIVGIYQSPNVYENGSMVMELGQLQKLVCREGEVTGFNVVSRQRDRESIERVASEIKALAPGLDPLAAREYVDTAVEMRMARAVAWLTSTIALVIGTIGMVNTMMTAIFERTREIAVLRAIGWRKWNVMKLIMVESILLAMAGAVVGTLLAIGLTQLLSRMPASGRLVSGDISMAVVLQGVVIALLVGIVGGIYPAYRAARAVPVEGLRHE